MSDPAYELISKCKVPHPDETPAAVRDGLRSKIAALEAELRRVTAERDALRAAAKMRIDDWDNVTQPGAAAEGCPDPADVAALRKALRLCDGEGRGTK